MVTVILTIPLLIGFVYITMIHPYRRNKELEKPAVKKDTKLQMKHPDKYRLLGNGPTF